MVKIYVESGASFSGMAAYVSLEDYESLKAALREALGNWDVLLTGAAKPLIFEHRKRISELRKFLDDK